MSVETTKQSQKRQNKRGRPYDVPVLRWIGHQYAIRLDQLPRLLEQQAHPGVINPKPISEGVARDVVTRWKNAGWVEAEHLRAREWIWLTCLGLSNVGLFYSEQDIRQSGLERLSHLAAINEIRLRYDKNDDEWISERQLLWEVDDQDWLRRPDAVVSCTDDEVIAIKAELSLKDPQELAESLLELIRGEEYLRHEYDLNDAREMSQGERSPFAQIWYVRPEADPPASTAGPC